MHRMTSDNPEGNYNVALNLFYSKEGWTWVRGGGPGPEYPDVSLCDYIREIIKLYGVEGIDADLNDNELSDALAESLFDGIETMEGLLATLYTAGWAFSTLRNKVKAYEDAGIPVILPNDLNIFDRAITQWGELAQTDIAIEEMSELTKAILKYRRSCGKPENTAAIKSVREEIADVYIMLAQLIKIFGGAEEIEQIVREKMRRLNGRLAPPDQETGQKKG